MSGQLLIFPGSLAEMLRFLIFKALFLKEVSQKSFVFELQSFIFEGSLGKASFLIFKASFLKDVSQKCFVFEF